jgi:HD superfamily phosphohydrolase
VTLSYELRVRDLLHGFVYLTAAERVVIDHPLFQRLRYVRQNDVASLVYPSLNTSRFEHSVGTAWVAGRMAQNIIRGHHWPTYRDALGLDEDEFLQTVRMYALLHDLGHLPLSHLFETAFEDYARRTGTTGEALCESWTGVHGYRKLHEAVGARLAPLVLERAPVAEPVRAAVLRLMTEKSLPHDDALRGVKLLVDSEIDADRADSTARDGRLAGGEYGTYDIERLSASVFVIPHGRSWRLGYSRKAVGTLESLLFDRYRTYTWIHHHHRIVSLRTAARELIARLLAAGTITADSLPFDDPKALSLVDDPWIWGLLRQRAQFGGLEPEWELLIHRDKARANLVWKWRHEWADLQDKVKERVGVRELKANDFSRGYEAFASERLGCTLRIFYISFTPVDSPVVPLTSEQGTEDHGDLLKHSNLVASLNGLWAKEPQYYATAFGELPDDRRALGRRWADLTVDWLDLADAARAAWPP